MRSTRRTVAAFTLIEVMISVAVIAVIVTLAAPSFREMILMQRLRGINAQLVTDMKFARSEAVSRNVHIQVQFQYSSGSTGMSCYIIFARTPPAITAGACDCAAAASPRCTDASTTTEVRTVQLPNSDSIFLRNATVNGSDVTYSASGNYIIDPRTGARPVQMDDGGYITVPDFIVEAFTDGSKRVRTNVDPSGRPAVCAPSGSTVGGLAC